jgi:hypothetical protein
MQPTSRIIVAAVAVLLAINANAQEQVAFTPDGFVYIDGEPRLVLGMYENPKDDAVLAQLAENGFNIVRASADKDALDRLHTHGLYAWIPLRGSLKVTPGDAERKAALQETIRAFKDHPALLSWEAPDEALWLEWFRAFDWLTADQPKALMGLLAEARKEGKTEDLAKYSAMFQKAVDLTYRGLWKESEALYDEIWDALGDGNPHPERHVSACIQNAQDLGDALTYGWEAVWEVDQQHVFWQNHAPGNSIEDMRYHNRGVHAAGCDIYPMPYNTGVRHGQLKDRNTTAVGGYTRIMDDSAPGKACWMVLQGFGWHDLQDRFNPTDPQGGRRPNQQETRFMAYNALLHGADAILYWGTHAIEKDSALWKNLMKVGKELRALEPAIVGEKPPIEPTATSESNFGSYNGGDPKLVLRKAGDDYVLFAHNECEVGVAFQVHGLPSALEGKTLYRLYTDEEQTVENGGFRDGIRGLEVHVYSTSKRFEADIPGGVYGPIMPL